MNLLIKKTLLFAVVLLLMGGEYAKAQTVRYTTESKTKFHGMGNLAARMMGSNKVEKSTYFISPTAMRSDTGKNESTIFSLDDEKIVTLNHKKKRYYEMTFDQMQAYMDDAKAKMGERMEEVEDSGFDPNDISFEVSVEDLGETQNVAGYKADRKLMRLSFNYEGEMDGAPAQSQVMGGNMHTISDMWIAQGVEGEEVIKQFGENYLEKLGAAFSEGSSGMAGMMQMFQQDGAMSEAMENMRKEMQKVDGVALKTTVYMVVVPQGKELDLDAVLNGVAEEPKKKRGGLGKLARGALSSRGINIGGDQEEEETPPEMQEQRTFMEMETIYTAIEMVSDDAGRYQAPGKYKMVDAPKYFGDN